MTIPNIAVHVTGVAPVNIAVIKYWGKYDVNLILPTNSSLSVTLDTAHLHSKTSIHASPAHSRDRFWLNGIESPLTKRVLNCLSKLRARRRELEISGIVQDKNLSSYPLHICSINNFPTAAGLASSASGLACLVYTLARLYQLLDDNSPIDAYEKVSGYARLGSGSACRSLFGGYVKWEMGSSMDGTPDAITDGSDSVAVPVASRSHWPDMCAFILVVNDQKKDVSSTDGMQQTVKTSTLFVERIRSIVPDRISDMEDAIAHKDFEKFAKLTMQDSNQFHAVCLDTFPPIFYLNDTSKQIIAFVHRINQHSRRSVIAYTFDAGPNAVLFFLQHDLPLVSAYLEILLGSSIFTAASNHQSVQESTINLAPVTPLEIGSVKRVIETRVGDGPQLSSDSLLTEDGYPIHQL